jgi:hypothetical protein
MFLSTEKIPSNVIRKNLFFDPYKKTSLHLFNKKTFSFLSFVWRWNRNNTSRRSWYRSFQILVFLDYQTRFFLILIFRQDSSREERNKILDCSSKWTESCLIDQGNRNQGRMTRYLEFLEVQTSFFSFRFKDSYLMFKINGTWCLCTHTYKYRRLNVIYSFVSMQEKCSG